MAWASKEPAVPVSTVSPPRMCDAQNCRTINFPGFGGQHASCVVTIMSSSWMDVLSFPLFPCNFFFPSQLRQTRNGYPKSTMTTIKPDLQGTGAPKKRVSHIMSPSASKNSIGALMREIWKHGREGGNPADYDDAMTESSHLVVVVEARPPTTWLATVPSKSGCFRSASCSAFASVVGSEPPSGPASRRRSPVGIAGRCPRPCTSS